MAAERQVKTERTGWRDEWISNRHRGWGWDCPMVDIDWLVVDYTRKQAVAIVEYKAKGAKQPNPADANYTVLRGIADKLNIPFFVVFYSPDEAMFMVEAFNPLGKAIVANKQVMTERQYVGFMYSIRKEPIDHALLGKLSNTVPERLKAWVKS